MISLIIFLTAINLTTTIWIIYLLNFITDKIVSKINNLSLEVYAIHSILDDITESLEIYEEDYEEYEEEPNKDTKQKEVK